MFKLKSLILSIVFFIEILHAQNNRALFVAIDKYPENSGWSDIHATNDYDIIMPMLEKSGYKKTDIQVLINEDATKKAIIDGLNKLYKKSETGDYIYIHFSCHGQQMADDNGDEEDGLDEALIPYDAQRRYKKGKYEGEKHLRDDELEKILDKIRLNIGSKGNVTVVLDACHSGTGTRETDDDEYVRGTSYIFSPDNYSPVKGKVKTQHTKNKNSAPISVFSACAPDDFNSEYKSNKGIYYGSLSYAFSSVIENMNNNYITHTEFSKYLERQMLTLFVKRKRKQKPYIETTDGKRKFRIGR